MTSRARIGIFALPELSHLHATLGLANKLVAAGHQVVYLTIADFAPRLVALGFETEVLAADIYGPGTIASYNEDAGLAQWHRQLLWARLGHPSTSERIAALGLNLLLVDVFAPYVAQLAFRIGLSVMMMSPTVPIARDARVPHFSESIVPGTKQAERQTRWNWLRRDWDRRYWKLRNRLWAWLDPGAAAGPMPGGYPKGNIDLRGNAARLMGFPEIVLCPAAFDLPRASIPAGMHYVEACVDLERDADAPLPNGLAGGLAEDPRPLVYCSFGSGPKPTAPVARVIDSAIELMRRRPDWRMLLVARAPAVQGKSLPDNVVRMDFAPQLRVLRHAAAAITHAGLNTVKECISLGVPMVACPLIVDQPGNAARIAYHGIGVMLRSDEVDVERLEAALDHVLTDPATRDRAMKMQAAFASAERDGAALQVITRYLPA